jgi:hypothetical protein
MPALAPKLSPESVLLPEGVVLLPEAVGLLLPALVLLGEEIVDGVMNDVTVLPFVVKTATEPLSPWVEPAPEEVGPDVAVAELGAPEELSCALVAPKLCVCAVDPDAEEEPWVCAAELAAAEEPCVGEAEPAAGEEVG